MEKVLFVGKEESWKVFQSFLPSETEADWAGSIRASKSMLFDSLYTAVFLSSPLEDGSAREYAIQLASRDIDAVLIVASGQAERITIPMARYSVAVLPYPYGRRDISFALSMILSAKEKLGVEREKRDKLIRKLDEEKVITRAKCLMAKKGMEEEEAHRFLTQMAMDMRISLFQAATLEIRRNSK